MHRTHNLPDTEQMHYVVCHGRGFRGEMRFSPSLIKIEVRFFLCRFYEHLFCKHFVRRSGYKRQKCKNTETLSSRLLFMREVWFFVWRFNWLMRIYSMNNLCVRLQKAYMYIVYIEKRQFLENFYDRSLIFYMKHEWASILKNILSVCLSVRLQKT